nr:hypothetical protein L203_00767 [Cryptococcus depauperatus CBS 7841]
MSNRPHLIHSSTSPRQDDSTHLSQFSPPSSHSLPSSGTACFHNPSSPPSPRATKLTSLSCPRKSLGLRKAKEMIYERAQKGEIISNYQGSQVFDKLPISEKEIHKLPKKLRPYYTKLAVLHRHYVEVDSILSGSLPANIALSFAPSRSYVERLRDLEEEIASPGWRRGSYWRINGNREGNRQEQEEAEETTALLGSKVEKRERIAHLAIIVNTIVNILLVVGKTVAVFYSSSISLTASLVDSALDLLSTLIILGTSWAIGWKVNRDAYPTGKRRFEPLGVLIFSVAMIASFVQVFVESFQRAITPSQNKPVDLGPLGLGVMLATIGIKFVLRVALTKWLWCSQIPSSGVQALAQDAENDVFFNIMSLAFPWIGSFMRWQLLDPIGGMIISAYIIFEWIKTLHENFAKLSGKTASADQITRILYLVSRFNPVLEIADVECYHIGDDLIVEVDVILPKTSTLHFAHDVGETIQCVLESLDGIIRAYVHCDYSSSNPQQHTAHKPQPFPVARYTSCSSPSSDSATPTPKASQYLGLNGVARCGGSNEAVHTLVEEPEDLAGDVDER